MGKSHTGFDSFYFEKSAWISKVKNQLGNVIEFEGIYTSLFNTKLYYSLVEGYSKQLEEIKIKGKGKKFDITPPKSKYIDFDITYVNLLINIIIDCKSNKAPLIVPLKEESSGTDMYLFEGSISLSNDKEKFKKHLQKLENIGLSLEKEITRECELLAALKFKREKNDKISNKLLTDPIVAPKDNFIEESYFENSSFPPRETYKNRQFRKKRKRDIFMCCFFCISCCKSKRKKIYIRDELEDINSNSVYTPLISEPETEYSNSVVEGCESDGEEVGFPFEKFYIYKLNFIKEFFNKLQIIKDETESRPEFNLNKYDLEKTWDYASEYREFLDRVYNRYKSYLMKKDFLRIENKFLNPTDIRMLFANLNYVYDQFKLNRKSKIHNENFNKACNDIYVLISENLSIFYKEVEREFNELRSIEFIGKSKIKKIRDPKIIYEARF